MAFLTALILRTIALRFKCDVNADIFKENDSDYAFDDRCHFSFIFL